MKKGFVGKLFTLLMGVSLMVGAISTLESGHFEQAKATSDVVITFPGSPSTYTNSYSSSFRINNKDANFTFSNWNNGTSSNAWDSIRGGSKNGTWTGTITTTEIASKVESFVVTVSSATTAGGGTSKLEVATDSSFSNIIETINKDADATSGDKTYTVTKPTANCYYRLTHNSNKGSSNGEFRISAVTVNYSTEGSGEITYTGVTVSQKTSLTGQYKGSAYYECQAAVSGTGNYLNDVTWSLSSSNTYSIATSVEGVASIDSAGKINFLDNGTVYVWATAADDITHNTSGFAVTATGLIADPKADWKLIKNTNEISAANVYALSNDGINFASDALNNNGIVLTSSIDSIAYFGLVPTSGGYYLTFASFDSKWQLDNEFINNSSSTNISTPSSTKSSIWTLAANGTNGVYLKNSSNSNRHLGVSGDLIKAYASSNISTNLPVYLYEVGSLPVIKCDTIEFTSIPDEDLEIGNTFQLEYYALGEDAEDWLGDVIFSSSDQSVAAVNDSGLLTAVGAGKSTISVQDKDGNADPDSFELTVLDYPERIDLPAGTYEAKIDAADETSSTLPDSREYEVISKEGRTWYKNLSVDFTNTTVKTSYKEYCVSKTNGSITITNNTNAVISKVSIHYYQRENCGLYETDSLINPTSSTGISGTDNDIYRYYEDIISSNVIHIKNNAGYDANIYSITIQLTVIDENEEFLNLSVEKSSSWGKTSYKIGDTPSAEGLIVKANYTTDGTSISRTQDVTKQVEEWTFNPSVLSLTDTSFTVIAKWNGHLSSLFTVNGITVLDSKDKTFDLTIDSTATATEDEISWVKPGSISIVNLKGNASPAANNYYPGSGESSTRFYNGNKLTIKAEKGYLIDSISFEATSDGYATTMGGSISSSLANVKVNSKEVDATLKVASESITISVGGTCGFKSILVSYHANADRLLVNSFIQEFLNVEGVDPIAFSLKPNVLRAGGACLPKSEGGMGYYDDAIAQYNTLNADAKEIFGTNAELAEARARLQAWATANGKTITFDATTGAMTINSARNPLAFGAEEDASILIVTIVTCLTAFAGVALFLRKKKRA